MYKTSTKLLPIKWDDAKRAENSSVIASYRAPDATIAYLFALLKPQKLTTDETRIHKAIYTLKQHYSNFFNDLIFSTGDIYPHSKELERILFRFQQSNILGTMNPKFEVYIINQSTKDAILQFYDSKFSSAEKAILREMSEKIDSEKLLSVT